MKTTQIDLFGNEVDATEVEKTNSRRYKTMQQMHGTDPEHTCKECVNLMREFYHGKTYFKCSKWYISNSSATDIRLKNTACKLYKKGE